MALERPAVVKGVDAGVEVFGDDSSNCSNHRAHVAARRHVLPETLRLDALLGRQAAGGRADRLSFGLKWMGAAGPAGA